jgi:hypothetical protein
MSEKQSSKRGANRSRNRSEKPASLAPVGLSDTDNGESTVRNLETPPPSSLRGLLPTPPEVAELVAREVARLPMSAAARQRVTNSFNLQYYFGGHEVAFRETRHGVEVLAAGLEEVSRFFQIVPSSQRRGVVIGHPEPW